MFAHARRLRWSGEILGYKINIEGLVTPDADLGVPGGRSLVNLVNTMIDGGEISSAREDVIEDHGDHGLLDAAAVFGNFEMMNRIAEGSGIPVPPQAVEREAEMMKTLGLYDILKSQQL